MPERRDYTHAAVRRRLARVNSCIVSYRRTDGACYATIEGHGGSFGARVADADAQLPAGEWLREAISTPASIFSDLVGRSVPRSNEVGYSEHPNAAFSSYERKSVLVNG